MNNSWRRVQCLPYKFTERLGRYIITLPFSPGEDLPFMPAPDSIKRLVDHFDQNHSSYLSPHYKEAQLRQDFLNPFFIALGWDLYNENNFAEAYRDVIIESSVEVEGAAKAPDYSFRIGGNRKFFVEAKKPSVNIEYDIHPAFQVRRYAWSAKLPLSILTDFEEFAVYDCRTRPDKSDKAATGRVKLLNYKDYLTSWDEIADTFSKDAVLHGKFDQFAASATGKRGTQEVDDAFLQEIEKWRDLLAHNLALRNPNLSTRELNYAVQMTIDRIIFLRICEDRQIEPENRLKDISSGEGIYPELVNLFRQADARYNSGLFHFNTEKGQSSTPDDLTPALSIDDKVLKEIVSGLYYPSPYVFRVLPADILGQVYERFLGKVIRLTAGHQAKVEEKPEVRKAGGVYYTPTYIVDYIVKNTVGKLLENKTPTQITGIKIVDPACGSGSFLLGAYQYLLDWHIKWYSDNQPEKWVKGKSPAIYQAQGGWRLTTAEKKKILLNNLHGVDIDPQAVEVTKLSLSLKVLEGESQETLNSQLSLFKERALPDLAKNIQCGNSLIGTDYSEGKLFTDEEERLRVNPFDWQVAFPQVFAQGGFDAVIGNPPYIRIQVLREWAPSDADYYRIHYISASRGNYDIYVVFVERAIDLLNENGKLGYILPHKFFNAQFAKPFRKLMTYLQFIEQIVYFGSNQVFENATTYTCLLFLCNNPQKNLEFININNFDNPPALLDLISKRVNDNRVTRETIPSFSTSEKEWSFVVGNKKKVIDKLKKQEKTLGDITRKIFQGLATSSDKIYVLEIRQELINTTRCYSKYLDEEIEIENGLIKPFLFGKDVHRFAVIKAKNVVIFPYLITREGNKLMSPDFIKAKFPKGWNYLSKCKTGLSERERDRMRVTNFYAYIYPKNLDEFESPKIITPDIANGPQMTLDYEGKYYHSTTIYSFKFKDDIYGSLEYFLGILNSKLLWFFLSNTGNVLRGGYFRFKTEYLKPFPIRLIDASQNGEIYQHNKLANLVKKSMGLLASNPSTPQEKESLQREIAATDKQIDNLVYQLYGLTPEEIKIVEGEK